MKSFLIRHILDCYLEGYYGLDVVYKELSNLGWSNNRITLITIAITPQFGFSDN